MLGRRIEDYSANGQMDIESRWVELLHPDDREGAERTFQEYLHTPIGMYEQQFRLRHADGQWIWILSRGRILPGGTSGVGKVVVGTHIDITERIRTEEELKASEDLLKDVLQNIPDMIWLKDKDGAYLSCNTRFESFIGHKQNEIVGRTDYSFFPISEAEFFRERDRIAMEAGRPTMNEEWVTMKDTGEVTLLETIKTPIHDQNGKLIGILGISHDITERNRGEKALKVSEERFRDLFQTMGSGVAIYTVRNDGETGGDYIIQDFNARALALEHKERSEVVGRSLRDLRPNIDGYGLIPIFRQVWKTGQPAFYPAKVYSDEKYYNWYENTVFRLPSGEVVAIYNDVTESKRAEEELIASKRLLDEMQDAAKIGGWSFDVETMRQKWTEETFRIMEIDNVGGPPLVPEGVGFIAPAYRPMAEAALQRAMQLGESYDQEWEIITLKGNRRWVHSVGRAEMADGKVKAVSGSFQDITGRKRAEDELKNANAYLQSLLDHANAPIVVWDQELRINTFNHAFERLTGLKAKDVLGRHIEVLFPEGNREHSLQLIRRTPAGDQWEVVEIPILTVDGQVRTVLWNSAVIMDKDGSIVATIAQGQDITDRLRSEEALRMANRKLNLLSSITRHDISNTMMVLDGQLGLLAKQRPALKNNACLVKARSAAQRVSSMIHFTKVYEDIGVHEPRWHDVRDLVSEAITGVHLGHLSSENDIPPRFQVFADPLIVKVFHNLVDNAVRHGGKATKIRFYLETGEGSQAIVCEDDGIGISPEMKTTIFQHDTGADHGLGLFLCKEILSITDISLSEEGEEGVGARFVMRLPKGSTRIADG
jgi:PAS domain S-box-containing protein